MRAVRLTVDSDASCDTVIRLNGGMGWESPLRRINRYTLYSSEARSDTLRNTPRR